MSDIGKWVPIATAPKDRTPVLVCGGSYAGGSIFEALNAKSKRPAIAQQITPESDEEAAEYADCSDQRRRYHPTHWMPLPETPAS